MVFEMGVSISFNSHTIYTFDRARYFVLCAY